MTRAVLLGVAIALFAAPTSAAQSAGPEPATGGDLPVVEHELANGMRILILPRPGAPTVATVVHFGVGGVDEVAGSTGTAHLLEHLLFKGSSRIGTTDVEAERLLFARMDAVHRRLLSERARPAPDSARMHGLRDSIAALEDSARAFVVPNEFERTLSQAGARGLNATTTSESTIYFVELPANRLELWFALEAERMGDPVFREFHTEREVVMEERRLRVENSPGGKLYEAHLAAAYAAHPYGQPVVGWMSDLRSLTRDGVAEYYRRFYGARNAVVAIVGDVDPARVVELAERWFAPLPSGELPPPVLTEEPPQRGVRRVEVLHEAEPALRMGWHVPGIAHDDAAAIAMLSALLTGGRTSVLYRRLVQEDRTATSILGSVGPGDRYTRLLALDAVPRAPHGPEDLEAAILAEIDRLHEELVPEVALQRVRNQLAASEYRRLRSDLGLALQLATSEAFDDDWRSTFGWAERISTVTPEDVRRVARRYLTRDRLTVGVLRREGSR